MGTGYVRQSAANIADGEDIIAAPLNAEFNAIRNAFDAGSGHSHDGTVGEGPLISLTTSISGILPVANGGIAGINKLNATTAPTTGDDSGDGYSVGSMWIDTTNDRTYICVDSTVAAAIWREDVVVTAAQTLTNKTLTAPNITNGVLTTNNAPYFQIEDATATHQYFLRVNELVDDVVIYLPALTDSDDFVFANHEQTLGSKTLEDVILSGDTQADDHVVINRNDSPSTGSFARPLEVSQDDDMALSAQFEAYGPSSSTYSTLLMTRSRGTKATKTAVSSGDILGEVRASGYGSTGYSSGPAIRFEAAQTHSDVNNGSQIVLLTAPIGSPTEREVLRAEHSGLLTLPFGQISFPEPQNASSGANVLDDYEEGTFTPTILGLTSAGVGTYSVQQGTYTKIGRLVFMQLAVTWSAHTGTGAMAIGGLPFTVAGVTPMSIVANNLTFSNQLAVRANGSSAQLLLISMSSGASATTVTMDTAGEIQIAGCHNV